MLNRLNAPTYSQANAQSPDRADDIVHKPHMLVSTHGYAQHRLAALNGQWPDENSAVQQP